MLGAIFYQKLAKLTIFETPKYGDVVIFAFCDVKNNDFCYFRPHKMVMDTKHHYDTNYRRIIFKNFKRYLKKIWLGVDSKAPTLNPHMGFFTIFFYPKLHKCKLDHTCRL